MVSKERRSITQVFHLRCVVIVNDWRVMPPSGRSVVRRDGERVGSIRAAQANRMPIGPKSTQVSVTTISWTSRSTKVASLRALDTLKN
jgi:hypothetical protein